MDIAVIGAGIAGLVAAHRFRRDGHAVTVLERDRAPAMTAGYRLHLDQAALNVLRESIPAEVFAALQSSGTGGEAFTCFSVLDERGRTALRLPRSDGSLMIGRRPLRRILLRGLADNIRWGVEASRIESSGSRVAVVDGTGRITTEADLVVAADGTGSPIAADVIGRPTAHPTGVVAIAGRTPVNPATRSLIPTVLDQGPAFVFGPHASSAFLSVHQPRTRASVEADLEEPYLLWSVLLDAHVRPRTDLLPRALDATRSWSSSLRALLELTDPSSVAAFTFYRPTALTGWSGGRVAVVGDAAHPIAPTAGRGASIAIMDVGDLAAALNSCGDPVAAVARMQPAMLRRAATAQRSSARILAARSALRREWLRRPTLRFLLPMANQVLHRIP